MHGRRRRKTKPDHETERDRTTPSSSSPRTSVSKRRKKVTYENSTENPVQRRKRHRKALQSSDATNNISTENTSEIEGKSDEHIVESHTEDTGTLQRHEEPETIPVRKVRGTDGSKEFLICEESEINDVVEFSDGLFIEERETEVGMIEKEKEKKSTEREDNVQIDKSIKLLEIPSSLETSKEGERIEEGDVVVENEALPEIEEMKTVIKNGYEVSIPINRPVRVYADGIFDLFHFGHARSLMQAKNLFPETTLIVGVCDDKLTQKMKGKTVLNERERADSVRHCRYVDEVILHAPWCTTSSFVKKHKIDIIVHGEDDIQDGSGSDVYHWAKKSKKFVQIQRTEGVSTSDIIMRIVKEYDAYVLRNLHRGYSRHEMNVGLAKETEIKFKEKLDQWKKEILKIIEKVGKL